MIDVIDALARGGMREIVVVLEAEQREVLEPATETEPAKLGEVIKPAVKLRFKVRKLDSDMLAEHGVALLFTEMPLDLSILAGGAIDVKAMQEAAQAAEQGDDEGAKMQALAALGEQIEALKGIGPGFFKKQARNADAVVCAGVRQVWQPVTVEFVERAEKHGISNQIPPELRQRFDAWREACQVEAAKPDGEPPPAPDDLGYWREIRFVMRETDVKPENNPPRLPLTVLSQNKRKVLAQQITAFSNDDGGVADLIRSF